MPNHIKNRITIDSSREELKEIINKFGTEVPARIRRAYDNTIICNNAEAESIVYFDETTGTSRKPKRDLKENEIDIMVGIPKGFEIEIIPGYLHFPDFNKIIPQPENIFNQDLSLEDEEECRSKGIPTWYDWNRENWGTKWNSYSFEREYENVFTFETAWSAVPKLIEKMSIEFPNVKFTYEFADEDTGFNCGIYEFQNGFKSKIIPEGNSKEAYDIAFRLRPEFKKYYSLNTEIQNYEYIGDE